MSKQVNKILLLLLLTWVTQQGIAQNTTNGTGSFFSAFGLGALKQSFSPMAEGMGLNGVALDVTRTANFANPSLLSEYQFTTGYGAVQQTLFTASKDGATAAYSEFQFDGLGLVFPIQKRKSSFAVSFNPVSVMNYSGEQTGTIPGDTTIYSSLFTGTGGINDAKFSIGYQLTKYISVGYGFSYIFGSVRQMKTTLFEDLTYRTTSSGTNDHYSGIAHEFGLTLFVPSLFREMDRATVGFSLRLPSSINASRSAENLIFSNSVEQPISSKLFSRTVDLPLSAKTGLTYTLSEKWLWGSDILIENWAAFNSLDASSQVKYTNRLRIGSGVAYLPEIRSSSGFFASISYRFGASYDTGYFSVNETSIQRIAAHAGLTFLSAFTPSSVDFTMEFGILGFGQTQFVQEEFLSFKFVVNLSEFMFFRRQLQ